MTGDVIQDKEILVQYLHRLVKALGEIMTISDTVPDAGWTVTGVTPDRVYNVSTVTLTELANVVGTLITALVAKGIITL